MSEKLFIGTSGWSYPDWVGIVYPRQRPRGFSGLDFLSDLFDAVEVNSSFYRPPTARVAAAWLRRVQRNPRFLFTAKLWKRFTHERDEYWTAADVELFKEGLRPLVEAGKLGAVLMQFPWSFSASPAHMDWLGRLADAFSDLPLVVEVRHVSWNSEEPMAFLRTHHLNFCNIDQPHSPEGLGRTNTATGPIAYYRFHGRNRQAWFRKDAGRDERYNYLYSEEEMSPWVKDIASMLDDADRIFVMNNNHYRGQAVANALQLKAHFGAQKVAVPESLTQNFPVLKGIAVPRPGQRFLDF